MAVEQILVASRPECSYIARRPRSLNCLALFLAAMQIQAFSGCGEMDSLCSPNYMFSNTGIPCIVFSIPSLPSDNPVECPGIALVAQFDSEAGPVPHLCSVWKVRTREQRIP